MRKRKLLSLLVLLMTAVTGAWADADVTWNSSNVSDLNFWGGAPDPDGSYTKEGVTLRGNAEQCDAVWANYGDGDGINFNMNASGGYTFTAPDGKKFTKIEMTIYRFDGWYDAAEDNQLGSGWPSGYDAAMTIYYTNKVTWTGDATSTVDLLTDAGLSSFGGVTVSSIEFYFEAPAEPVASWVGNSAINANGTWYNAGSNFGWCTGGAFNGADLGTITELSLGGQSQAWAAGNANWNDGNLTMTMGYKIDGGADESLSLNWFGFADNNNKFQSGGSSWAAQDIDISGLAPGNHTIAVWFTRDDKWDSNNSANYVANFTIPTPAPTTYTVTMKEGTLDASNWVIDPANAASGTEITLKYNGRKKVKSITIEKAAAEPAGPTTVTWDFSQLSGAAITPYENGGVTLSGGGFLDFDDNSLTCFDELTFTAPSGKKFTSIVITASEWFEFYGTGWSGSTWSDSDGQTTINFTGGAGGISTIVFTLVAASAEPEPAGPTLAATMTTADMTVKVNYNYHGGANYCLFVSNGDGTYTFQSGDGYAGDDAGMAKALVVEGGKLVFKQNYDDTIDDRWDRFGFSVTFDTSNNTYTQWFGTETQSKHNPSFTSVEVNETTISLTAAPAAAEGHPLSASEVGEIVCSDGLAYAAADKDNLPTGVTAVAIVAYVGDAGSVDASSSTYKGLAIAMSDANDGSSCEWGEWGASYDCVSKSNGIATAIGYKDGISSTNTLTSDGHYHVAATAAASNNGTAAPTGTSGWFLPSMGQWNLIVQGLASKKAGSDVTTDITTSENSTYAYSNLNSVITAAGGTGFNGDYQSSTLYDSDWCWHMNISEGRACGYAFYAGDLVRSVLAF